MAGDEHGDTPDQELLDGSHSDPKRGRMALAKESSIEDARPVFHMLSSGSGTRGE